MKKKDKKKKIAWQQYVGIMSFMLIGVFCGIIMSDYIYKTFGEEASSRELISSFLGIFVIMYLAMYVQIIIHEAGHLVFGLLSGYRFSSFRIMGVMLVKEDGKIRFRRLTVAGTGGQCLMVPPELVDGKIPVILYNLGGSLMNIFAGIVFLGCFFIFKNVPFLSVTMLMLAIIGFAFAIINGVPLRMGTVDNDGYNAFALTRDKEALHSFWIQLKVNDEISRGVRLKDMPDEWFVVPVDENLKNSMNAAAAVFVTNRLMDRKQFDEADNLMAHLLEIDSGMIGLHRNLMICDRMYLELIAENRKEVLEKMYTKEQKQFMKNMKNFPSVIRTEYVYAIFAEGDAVKAEKIKKRFEKSAKTYPYASDIQSERELMEIAVTRYKEFA